MNALTCAVTAERICQLLKAQARSAELWIGFYDHHKDVSSIRNAAFAIGKVSGHYNVLLAMGIEIPQEIIDISTRMHNIWSNLELGK